MATAGQRDFLVPFPYLHQSHVRVMINGQLAAVLEWVTAQTLRLSSTLVAGDKVEIERNTPIELPLVDFQNGAVLTEEDLNTAVLQLLYKQQEITGLYDRSLRRARIRILEANSVPITADDVALQVAAIAAEDALLDDFRLRISDILSNSETLLDHAQLLIDHTNALNDHSQDLIDGVTSTAALNAALIALTADHETLQGVVDALGSIEDGTGIAAIIQAEQDARIVGDTALAATIALIGAKSGDNSAFILDLNKVKVSPVESLATRLSAISAAAGANNALILAEQTARANADTAEATARTTLGATLQGQIGAAVTQEAEARASADAAEATARTNLAATLRGETSAAIATEATTRATADSAEAASRLALASTLRGETSAAIATEATTRADADSAEAALRVALASTLRGETNALIATEATTRATADTAEANARTALAATLRGETNALILTEQTARASADGVFVNSLALLGAQNGNGSAFVLNEGTIILANGASFAARLSGIDTALGANTAAIVSEQFARADADTAIAQSVSTLGVTVGNNSASVTSLTQAVNGIQARYGVSLDVNGKITGFVQNNNGQTGTFDILADKFRVTMPGVAPLTVFTVDANGVAINGNVRVDGNLIVNGTLPTTSMPQHTVSISAYYQTTSGGSLANFTQNVWVDFDPATAGGSGGGGGGAGGGGPGGGLQSLQ